MEEPTAERAFHTEDKQPLRYKKVKGTSAIEGQIFEYKFCALTYIKAINEGLNFKLGCNVEGFGVFDDVVLDYLDASGRTSHICVQLKWKERRQITVKQLLADSGDFSLIKHYNSYIEIEKMFKSREQDDKTKDSIDECLFIIYTNTDVEERLKSDKSTEVGQETFLNTGGYVLKLSEETHKDIYEHMKEKPRYREFLSRYRIMYNQANEKEMDCYIIPPLQEKLKLCENERKLACQYFCEFIMSWWQEKHYSYFLEAINTKGNDLLQKTSEELRITSVANILDRRKSELDDLSIIYKESAIRDMKHLTEPNKAVLIFAPGRSTTLTVAKIHQMLSATKHSILNLQQLLRYKSEVMLAWKSSFDVLVLESQISTESFEDVAVEISSYLNECGVEKKIIFISGRLCNIQQLSDLRETLKEKLREEYDDWKFTDIITESTTFLLEKMVIFQGREIQIKNLVKESDFRMLNALDCDSLSLLLGNENPSIGTPTENSLEYYIERALGCLTNFKSGNQTEDVTLVQFRKESLEELQGTSSYMEEKCDVSDHGQEIPRFSLDNVNVNMKRRQYTGTNTLESLCTKDQKLYTAHNIDEFLNVQRGSQRNSTKIWRPSTLLDSEERIILVTDDPGMGKSTLLTHLAQQTRERHPDVWIVRVNINHYTSILHSIKTNGFEEKDAIKLLTEAAQIKETECAQLEKQLFNYIYNSTGSMVVLIDGVDEVSPYYTKVVIQILEKLSKTRIRKIWVTSRNSMRDHLEQELHCQSYTLVPFSVEDQKSFLVKFWNHKFSHMKADYLERLAHRVVELSSKHLSVREKTFMGIPLQSMLLAEVFEENLNQCSASRMVELPENINLLMLYDFYVKKKWDIYLFEKKLSDRTNVNVITDDEALYDIFIDNHKAAALRTILSTHQLEKLNGKNVLKIGEDFLQKTEQGLEKTGIITDIIEGRPVFLHRTFAEYFVASWLCDNFMDNQIFMREHLFESGFDVVRGMVDRMLANKCTLHQAVLNSNTRHVARLLKLERSVTQKDRAGRTPLHVAISCRNPELTRLLLVHGADVSSVDNMLGLSPVEYAIRMDDWEMLSLLMEKRPEIREQVLSEINFVCTEYITSAFRVAARYGHTDLLRYLIGRGNCVNMVLPGDSGTLLHEAARGNHIQTIRTLVALGGNCDIQDAKGQTALHVSAETGSLEIAKFIVERREMPYEEADLEYIVILQRVIRKIKRLNLHDKDGHTPLHLAAAAGNTSTVRYLLSAGSYLRSCNTRGEYPLALAARYGRNDTVKLLLQSCSVVEYEEIMTSALRAAIVAGQVDTTALLLRSGTPVSGGENEKPIHVASRMGHKEIVILLLKFGASLTSRSESGNTALHLASEHGNLGLVKYLAELQTDGLYNLNNENETPLHFAARNGRDYVVTYLVEKGCNINAASANGATCLHVACENGHYTTVEYLVKHGADVNSVNSADQTPLHIAAGRGQNKIVELLIQHKSNFSLRDKDGITALLAASINEHQDTVLFIVQHGGNLEDTDGKGNTIAHFAVENENYDVLNFISKQETVLEVQNSDGETPLIKAVREGKKGVVQCLATKYSVINTQGNDGMRPLDFALLKGNMEITHLLLERNARSYKSGMHIVAAAQFGFLDLLQGFVDREEDINVKADNGESPLHAACKSGQVATVQYLCEHGAILDLEDNNGNTALLVAVSNGHLDATRVLVEKGTNLCAADASGSTALHITAKGGYLNIVQYLADSFAPIDMKNAINQTALLVAAAEGHEKIVSVLIEQGAGIGVRDIEGKTAIDIATEKDYFVITQLLKERAEGRTLVCSNSHTVPQTELVGGNFELLQKTVNAEVSMDRETQKNDAVTAGMIKTRAEATQVISNPRCALHTAAENGNFEQVERLVKAGIALDYRDTFGRTALWGAASRGHKSIVRILIASGSCVNIPDCEGVRPIEIAAREGHWDVVHEVLEHDPTVGPEGEEYLRCQLYEASESGELEVVRIILKCGINVNAKNNYGHTPLHVAANSGQIETCRILLKSGANINIADNLGRRPLTLAAERGHVEIIRNLLCVKDFFDGFKPLSNAALTGKVEVKRDMLENCAIVDKPNENVISLRKGTSKEGDQGYLRSLKYDGSMDNIFEEVSTSLYAAAINGNVEVVRELLIHGASVDSANNDGWTTLNATAEKGHAEVVLELLKNGAKLESVNKYGSTPLYTAAKNGHLEVVRELLKHGAIVDSADNDGWTPLNKTAQEGHAEVVLELLKNGAKMESVNKYGDTPLNTAAKNGHLEVVRELLKHGAIVDSANNDGQTSLNATASRGHAEVVLELLKNGAKLESVNKYGSTSIYTAALNGHLEVVRALLKHGASVNGADNDGWTPLNATASKGHAEVVLELLKNGAKVESVNKYGSTPLFIAAKNGHLEVVRALLKHGASVNGADNDGWTPLNATASRGHAEVVLELLKNGAKLESVNKYGSTPLYTAAKNGHLEVVRALMKHGASVDSANNDGWTPFNATAEKGHAEVVLELLKNGAKMESVNEFGDTPLNTAAKNGHFEVVRELLKHGAIVDSANNDGQTPLHATASRGHAEVVLELLKNGAKLESVNKYGSTPLFIAALNGHLEVVRALLKHGASVNGADNDGWTPLNATASTGHAEVVLELLKNGAKLESVNKYGSTPLYTAAQKGHLEVVRALLKHGASVDSENNDGWTPLKKSTSLGHMEIIRELQKHGAKI